jgi:Ca-activated chloride channel family protein
VCLEQSYMKLCQQCRVSVTWLEQELEGAREFNISRSAKQSIVVTFSIPDPKVTLDAPETAIAGSTIDVGWNGPNDSGDNIQIARPSEGFLQYTYVDRGNHLKLQMPALPGEYELRYVWKDRKTIAMVPITVTETPLSLDFPSEIPMGSTFEVTWTGPNVQSDNIQIGPVGGGYSHYVYTERGNPVQIIAPGIPGDYEIRYRFQDRESILAVPIKVVDAPLFLTSPPSVLGGTVLEIV